MSKLVLNGDTSGSVTLDAPAVAGTTTLTLPTTSGNVLTSASSIATSQLSGSISASSLPTGSVLQVVSTTKTDTFSTTSTSFVDVTGLSVSVTPSSTSSKILVICTIPVGNNVSGQVAMVNLVRGSTTICQPASSQLFSSSKTSYIVNGDIVTNSDLHFLDSPNTTSSTTYKIQIKTNTGTMYVGQRGSGDAATPSSITVMEIKG